MEQTVAIISNVYQLCCCCQELIGLKSLWSEYMWMDKIEVYGDMLKEVFDVSWPKTNNVKYHICEVCITQIRNAVQFKGKVLSSQAYIDSFSLEVTGPIKTEELQLQIENHLGSDASSIKSEIIQEENTDTFKDGAGTEITHKKKVKKKIKETSKDNRMRTRKKSRLGKDNINPRLNVAVILKHSTIVPFKSNKGYFNCLYCNKQFAGFEQLKIHVGDLHENLSSELILKSIYRPQDRIRADVSDINCRICKQKIDNLEILVQHLTDAHSVKFNFDVDTKPVNCILPYELGEGKYRCYQCKAEFSFFKTLSNHMNEHSSEYVCDVCGKCFLLADRLRSHAKLHDVGNSVKCEFCGKICGSNMLLKSHIRYKHKKLSFMCSICNKTFSSSHARLRHLEEVHNRTPLNLTCKICSRTFEKFKRLYVHMRVDHLNIKSEPKYACNECGMLFKTRDGLSSHTIVHTGEKNYECEVCHKKYGRRKTLIEHLRIHMNDRRWACGACSQAFVQKCSLKNHIRVHHGDRDNVQLIIDKRVDGN